MMAWVTFAILLHPLKMESHGARLLNSTERPAPAAHSQPRAASSGSCGGPILLGKTPRALIRASHRSRFESRQVTGLLIRVTCFGTT